MIKTPHIRCQLLRVSAPRCHLQGAYQQQRIGSPIRISGQSPSLLPLQFKVWKRWNSELHVSTSTCPHCSNSNSKSDQRLLLTSAATDTLWAVHTNSHTNMWPWGISYDASLWIIPWTYDPVADKLPEDDTLMPKHVAVGTECVVHFVISFIVLWLVHFVISFIVLWLVHFVGLKYGMKENTPYE